MKQRNAERQQRKDVSTMTKKEMFTAIAGLVDENNLEILDELGDTVVSTMGIIDFLRKEIALVDKRNSYKSKTNKKVEANKPVKEAIVSYLATVNAPATTSEITDSDEVQSLATEDKPITKNKVTALITQLRKEGLVKREYVKKVAYFSLGKEDDEDTPEE